MDLSRALEGVAYLELETKDGRKSVDAQGLACLIPKYE